LNYIPEQFERQKLIKNDRTTLSNNPMASLELEKGIEITTDSSPLSGGTYTPPHDDLLSNDCELPVVPDNRFFRWARKVENLLGLESRGIHRVEQHEQSQKTTLSFLQIVMLWFSINTAAQNITLGSIGPGVYNLGFTDSALCSVFGALVGSLPVAYTATWGPWSGNRTLVCVCCVWSCPRGGWFSLC
jgi:hypothetical protein